MSLDRIFKTSAMTGAMSIVTMVAALLREVLSGHLRMVHRAIPLFGHRVGEIHFLFDTLTDKFRFKIGQNT